jgi:hypothetical protein
MQVDYSKRALLKFLDFAAENGLMQPATVNARQVAVSRLLTDLTDGEEADVRTIDLDVAAQKFANRSGDLSPETLAAYKRRAGIAIDEFIEWNENPAEYQPRPFGRRGHRPPTPDEIDHLRRGRHQPSPEEISNLREARGGGRGGHGEHGGRHGGRGGRGEWFEARRGGMGGRPGMSNGLPLSFPLRPDFLAQVVVPRDLTTAEAKRLSAFLLTLASDYEPTV